MSFVDKFSGKLSIVSRTGDHTPAAPEDGLVSPVSSLRRARSGDGAGRQANKSVNSTTAAKANASRRAMTADMRNESADAVPVRRVNSLPIGTTTSDTSVDALRVPREASSLRTAALSTVYESGTVVTRSTLHATSAQPSPLHSPLRPVAYSSPSIEPASEHPQQSYVLLSTSHGVEYPSGDSHFQQSVPQAPYNIAYVYSPAFPQLVHTTNDIGPYGNVRHTGPTNVHSAGPTVSRRTATSSALSLLTSQSTRPRVGIGALHHVLGLPTEDRLEMAAMPPAVAMEPVTMYAIPSEMRKSPITARSEDPVHDEIQKLEEYKLETAPSSSSSPNAKPKLHFKPWKPKPPTPEPEPAPKQKKPRPAPQTRRAPGEPPLPFEKTAAERAAEAAAAELLQSRRRQPVQKPLTTPLDQLAFSKEKRSVKYEPTTLARFHADREALGLGIVDEKSGTIMYQQLPRSLGPSVAPEVLMAKRAARQRALEYAEKARQVHRQRSKSREDDGPHVGGYSHAGSPKSNVEAEMSLKTSGSYAHPSLSSPSTPGSRASSVSGSPEPARHKFRHSVNYIAERRASATNAQIEAAMQLRQKALSFAKKVPKPAASPSSERRELTEEEILTSRKPPVPRVKRAPPKPASEASVLQQQQARWAALGQANPTVPGFNVPGLDDLHDKYKNLRSAVEEIKKGMIE